MNSDKIESLRAIVADKTVAEEKRQEAARVLSELENRPENQWENFITKSKADYGAFAEDQNTRFQVCGSCYRKQARDRGTCELCSASKWEPAVIESTDGRRDRLIAAATTFTVEQLRRHVERESLNMKFAQHCARILELREIDRPEGFWERAGFDFYGRKTA